MMSSVTIDCQITKIVMDSGSQLSELLSVSQRSQVSGIGRDDFQKKSKNILAYSFLSVGYRKKTPCPHVELSPWLLYPPETPPYWQNFCLKAKTRLYPVSLVFLGQLVLYLIKPSSVTKRNIVDVLGNGLVMYYTPHQCWYSDRKSPCWENNQKVP